VEKTLPIGVRLVADFSRTAARIESLPI